MKKIKIISIIGALSFTINSPLYATTYPSKQHYSYNETLSVNQMYPVDKDSKWLDQTKKTHKVKPLSNQKILFKIAAACPSYEVDGSTLIDNILSNSIDCISEAFDQPTWFNNKRYSKVANTVVRLINNYDPDKEGRPIGNLFYYLRAALYNESYYSNEFTLSDAARKNGYDALDALIQHPKFYTAATSYHGNTILDAIIMMDSTDEQYRYVDVIKTWLIKFTAEQSDIDSMRRAVNGIFTIMFRGNYKRNFKDLVKNDSEFFKAADDFIRNPNFSDEAGYLKSNVALEFSRYMSDDNIDHIKSTLTSWLQDFDYKSNYPMVWMWTAYNSTYLDKCEDYGTCGWKNDAINYHLPSSYECNESLLIRAQDMSTQNFEESCEKLEAQEEYFHEILATGKQPVADDFNEQLEIIVFDDADNYQDLASALFDIDTNNGGIYLEGDPSEIGNKARFICYERWWDRSDFSIWNLEHEYVHYLDGRYNKYGGFSKESNNNLTWWTEGLAEYISKKNNNENAAELASNGSIPNLLSIFRQDYYESQERIYDWGYLAVRFMFESKLPDVDNRLVAQWRTDGHESAKDFLETAGIDYNDDFRFWNRNTMISNDEIPAPRGTIDPIDDCDVGCTGSISIDQVVDIESGSSGEQFSFYIDYSGGGNPLDIKIFGGSGDADLYVNLDSEATLSNYICRPYIGGNAESCSLENAQAGRYHIMINGYSEFSGLKLLATTENPAAGNSISKNQQITNLSGEQDEELTFILNDTGPVNISISGGTGDVDLYIKQGESPTLESYDCRPFLEGNNESCDLEITTTTYIVLRGYNDFSNITLSVY